MKISAKEKYNEVLKEEVEKKKEEWSKNLKDLSPLIRSKSPHDMGEAQALALSYRTMILDEISYFLSELAEEQKLIKELRKEQFCIYKTGLHTDGTRPKNLKNPLIGNQKIHGNKIEMIMSGDLSVYEYTIQILVDVIEHLREHVKTIDQYMYAIKNRLELFSVFK